MYTVFVWGWLGSGVVKGYYWISYGVGVYGDKSGDTSSGSEGIISWINWLGEQWKRWLLCGWVGLLPVPLIA